MLYRNREKVFVFCCFSEINFPSATILVYSLLSASYILFPLFDIEDYCTTSCWIGMKLKRKTFVAHTPCNFTERRYKNAVITFHNGTVRWNRPSNQTHEVTSTLGLEDGAKGIKFNLSFQEGNSKCGNRCCLQSRYLMNSGSVLYWERFKVILEDVALQEKQIKVLLLYFDRLDSSLRLDLKRNLQFPILGQERLHWFNKH